MADDKKKKDSEGSDLPGLIASGLAAAVKQPKAPKSDIYWHSSPSGELKGSPVGIHLGTKEAAKQALEARIGVPARGDWDGSRKYGETLLAGQKTMQAKGHYPTGFNVGAPNEDYLPSGEARYGDQTKIPLHVKPEIAPYRLKGEMSNTPQTPHEDFKANGYMAANLKKGTAKKGYYYQNVGEDFGSISIVVPHASHIEKISPEKEPTGLKIRGVSIKDMSLSKLQIAALKAFPSSPIQKEIHAEIQERMKKGEKVWHPKEAKSGRVGYADGGDIQAPINTDPQTDTEFNKPFAPRSAPQQPQSAPDGDYVNVFSPTGEIGSIPRSEVEGATSELGGYRLASDDDVSKHLRQQKYGTLGQQLKTGVEAAASAGTFGLSTGLETGLGIATPEDIQARAEENPASRMIGQGAGLVASSMLLPGGGAAGALEATGAAAAKAVGLGTPVSTVAKIGSAAVKGAVENALFQSGDEVSKMLSSQDGQFSETAIADIGLAGLIGGTLGGAIGSVHPLWEATEGSKVGRILKAVMDKTGGGEGDVPVKPGADMRPLRGLPKESPGPNLDVRQAAQDYHQASGIPFSQANDFVKADPIRGAQIAQAFDAMQHAPNDPAVKSAYDSLIKETLDQYQQVKKLGIKVEPIEAGAPNPYPGGSKQVLEDIRDNKHLWYFPTDQGFGTTGQELADHPLMAPTGEIMNGKPMLANDVFRVVHDVFGHAKEGNGFGPNGEENAWNSHVRMYGPEAAKAMTTETRGQNSWVNYGPFGEANRMNPGQTKYADQKAGLLPDWVMDQGKAGDRPQNPSGPMKPKDAMDHIITTSGMDLPPEIRAGLSNDPEVQSWFSTLNQSDTTASGRKLQESMNKFRVDAGEGMAKSLGKEVKDIPEKGEIDKYTTGKKIGDTLASEYHSQVDPLAKEYEAKRVKYDSEPLKPDTVVEHAPDYSNPYKPSSGFTVTEPGTTSQIAEKIAQRMQAENWNKLPDSDIAKEVYKVLDALPKQKTLNDLSGLGDSISQQMQRDRLTNGPLFRAGGIIKSILRDAEADVVGERLGKDAPEQLERFAALRKAYGQQAELKEALDSRLHAKGSTAGYAKSIREMAQSDGESVLKRLSGINDAEILDILQKNFPKTASLIRDYHVNNVLSAAKDGEKIRGERLVKALYSNQMSPQLRDFIAKPETLNRINALSQMLEKFNSMPHNFSNTARTVDKLFQYVPGSALSMVAMMTGHNPIMAGIVGHLIKPLAKDAPDAIKLAMLKFLGSDQPVSAGAFKSTVDAIQSTIKGENLLSKAAKNIFQTGKEVLPESQMPTESKTEKLDKQLKKLQTNQDPLLKVAGAMGQYLPDHAEQMGQTAARATTYLNSIRPNTTPANPLDPKPKPSSTELAHYNNALKIATQPLVIMDKIQKGTLTPEDRQHLSAMYPSLYARMGDKLTAEMTEHLSKDKTVPYKIRIGLSMFMAQSLDSTMIQGSILAAQPQPTPPPQPQSKTKGSSLAKLSKSYQTPEQAAESDRTDRA